MKLWSHLPHRLQLAFLGVLAILVLASLITGALASLQPERNHGELRQRVRTWWWMAGIFAVVLMLPRLAGISFFAFLSFMALKEYLTIIPTRRADRRVLFLVYLAIPVQYYWVGIEWYGMFAIFIPVYMFLLIPTRMVLIGETDGFLRAVGTLHWGLMAMVYSLSHLAYCLDMTGADPAKGGGVAALLLGVFLTQFNDVAQYVWGRTLGRHPVIPKVSPKKTWEGLIGGVLTTVGLATLLGPWLTALDRPKAAAAGLIIGLGGFIGDVTISALKRDLGLKDSGTLLPGHGGILDRVDSLVCTAPLWFHFLRYFKAW